MDTAVGKGSFLEVVNGRSALGKPEFFGRSVIVSSGTSPEQTLHPDTQDPGGRGGYRSFSLAARRKVRP
jgi:hypothetical protein